MIKLYLKTLASSIFMSDDVPRSYALHYVSYIRLPEHHGMIQTRVSSEGKTTFIVNAKELHEFDGESQDSSPLSGFARY